MSTTQTAPQPEATETAKARTKTVRPAGIHDTDGRVAWALRSRVDDVKAHWGRKTPCLHDVNGNCRGNFPAETRDRYWLAEAFKAEAAAEAAGEPRSFAFCVRCVIEYVPVATAVSEPEQAEVVEVPAKPETTISLDLTALDEAAASEETPEPEAVKPAPKARTPRTRKVTPRTPRASKSSKTS